MIILSNELINSTSSMMIIMDRMIIRIVKMINSMADGINIIIEKTIGTIGTIILTSGTIN